VAVRSKQVHFQQTCVKNVLAISVHCNMTSAKWPCRVTFPLKIQL